MLFRSKRKEFFLLSGLSVGVLIFLILLSHLNIKLYVSRYFMPAAYLVYLLLAGLLLTFFSEKKAWLWTAGIFSLFLLLLKPITYSSDWNQIAQLKKGGFIQEQIFVASNPFDYSTARYYFGQANVRYHNKNNPGEDFSGWVVVGNHNRIETLAQLSQLKNAVVVDGSCAWVGVKLEEIFKTEKLAVCRIVN